MREQTLEANTGTFATLICPSCGATLEVAGTIDRLTCDYCRTEHAVIRSGGSVVLVHIASRLRRVRARSHTETPNPAMDSTGTRLEREIMVLEAEVSSLAHKVAPEDLVQLAGALHHIRKISFWKLLKLRTNKSERDREGPHLASILEALSAEEAERVKWRCETLLARSIVKKAGSRTTCEAVGRIASLKAQIASKEAESRRLLHATTLQASPAIALNTTDRDIQHDETNLPVAQPKVLRASGVNGKDRRLAIILVIMLAWVVCVVALAAITGRRNNSAAASAGQVTETATPQKDPAILPVETAAGPTQTPQPIETLQPTSLGSGATVQTPGVVAAPASEALSAKVQVDALSVREGPGTNYPRRGMLKRDTTVPVTGQNADGSWYQVRLANGEVGWVSSDLVALSGAGSPQVAIAAPAPTATSPSGAPAASATPPP